MFIVLSYSGTGILTSFPFSTAVDKGTRRYVTTATINPVSGIALGLTHPRRTKLQHGTFLRFGHPRL